MTFAIARERRRFAQIPRFFCNNKRCGGLGMVLRRPGEPRIRLDYIFVASLLLFFTTLCGTSFSFFSQASAITAEAMAIIRAQWGGEFLCATSIVFSETGD